MKAITLLEETLFMGLVGSTVVILFLTALLIL